MFIGKLNIMDPPLFCVHFSIPAVQWGGGPVMTNRTGQCMVINE